MPGQGAQPVGGGGEGVLHDDNDNDDDPSSRSAQKPVDTRTCCVGWAVARVAVRLYRVLPAGGSGGAAVVLAGRRRGRLRGRHNPTRAEVQPHGDGAQVQQSTLNPHVPHTPHVP